MHVGARYKAEIIMLKLFWYCQNYIGEHKQCVHHGPWVLVLKIVSSRQLNEGEDLYKKNYNVFVAKA